MSEWTKVTADELKAFLATYPANTLTRDVTQICEPPLMSFNDFSGGKVWPESVVARVSLGSARPGGVDEHEIRTDMLTNPERPAPVPPPITEGMRMAPVYGQTNRQNRKPAV